MTHDYKPNGTASLFAGLEAAKGKVYGLCQNAIDTKSGLSFCACSINRCRRISAYT